MTQRRRDRGLHTAAAGLAVAGLLAGVALAGCGGGGGGTSPTTTTSGGGSASSSSAQGTTTGSGSGSANPFGGGSAAKGHTVSDVLDAVLTSGDPKQACSTDFVTDQYLSSAYGGAQGCAKAVTAKSAAQSVDIQGLEGGQSGTATVKVLAHGGVYDGEKITVTLVKDGQDWKVDSLKSNAPVGP